MTGLDLKEFIDDISREIEWDIKTPVAQKYVIQKDIEKVFGTEPRFSKYFHDLNSFSNFADKIIIENKQKYVDSLSIYVTYIPIFLFISFFVFADHLISNPAHIFIILFFIFVTVVNHLVKKLSPNAFYWAVLSDLFKQYPSLFMFIFLKNNYEINRKASNQDFIFNNKMVELKNMSVEELGQEIVNILTQHLYKIKLLHIDNVVGFHKFEAIRDEKKYLILCVTKSSSRNKKLFNRFYDEIGKKQNYYSGAIIVDPTELLMPPSKIIKIRYHHHISMVLRSYYSLMYKLYFHRFTHNNYSPLLDNIFEYYSGFNFNQYEEYFDVADDDELTQKVYLR
jgi:hypothetical protein